MDLPSSSAKKRGVNNSVGSVSTTSIQLDPNAHFWSNIEYELAKTLSSPTNERPGRINGSAADHAPMHPCKNYCSVCTGCSVGFLTSQNLAGREMNDMHNVCIWMKSIYLKKEPSWIMHKPRRASQNDRRNVLRCHIWLSVTYLWRYSHPSSEFLRTYDESLHATELMSSVGFGKRQ